MAFALTAREMMSGTREPFDYGECSDCGCLQIASLPEDLDRYYGADYYIQDQRRPRSRSRWLRPLRRSWSRVRLHPSAALRWVSGRRYGRFDWFRRTATGLDEAILDVGCGSGRLLRRLAGEGFSNLTGIDERVDPMRPDTAPDTTRGLRLERSALEDHRGCYALVMAHHSFEHMTDPVAAFAAFSRLVEPGGHLLLRIPRADSWARRHYGADWAQLDAPRHLHLHTRRSIEVLARGSGFRVSNVVDDSGPFQIWGSELLRRDVPLSEGGRGGRAALGARARLRAWIRAKALGRAGTGDQACFYLQRDLLGDLRG